ncbi:hypothetical protein CALCODRAFT_493412 [Calocera cornea HHB12733]|uniref:Concanavalin A-like lectin/glucanase n=1 Tax=Calocera cornea HHB12733 TaxID=1353952 RepID=A0A165HSF4_9BASI|nr:hypothetical protein CALCODRAFT_493412 [Calocera cornea HHB12733]
MLSLSVITGLLAALSCTAVNAAPTTVPAKRDGYLSGAIATTSVPLTVMTGNLIVPSMTVPAGANPTVLYVGQAFIGLSESTWQNNVFVGVQCFAGLSSGCEVYYEFGPSIPITASPNFTVSSGDLLLVTIDEVPTTGDGQITVINYSTGDQASFSNTGSGLSDLYLAWWMVGSGQGIDFGDVAWTETSAMTRNGSYITPDMAQTTYQMNSHTSVETYSWGAVITYN